MSTDAVAETSAPKTEATMKMGSMVCEVCQGIGEEGHPRSKTLDAPPDCSYYVYLHYPDPELLRCSFERYACQTCRLILSCVEFGPGASMDLHDNEHPRYDADRLANFDIAQDTREAASLAESAEVYERPGWNNFSLKIEGCGYGRVVLHILSSSGTSPRTTGESMDVRIHVFETASMAPESPLPMRLFCSAADPIDEDHVHRPAIDLLSDAYVALVRRWISICEAEHKTCLEHCGSMQRLPTRLLKIEGRNGEITRVKLIETSGNKGVYVCLSYCWGSESQLSMTTTANLDEYHYSIPWRGLPSTISDAIKLCHRLGFEHLWVDSLCIIQDNQQDWLREASDMAGTYSRSALTLAVHLCQDASESFLQQRLLDTEQWSDEPYGSARISFRDNSTGEEREMYFWIFDDFKNSRFLDAWWLSIQHIEKDQPSAKWFSRAWTLQEWFLSPRVLHIHGMTVWDCFSSRGNELEDRFISSEAVPRAFPRNWTLILENFTSRVITMDKDRLPALAGLAQRVQAQTGYVYLAGLWLEELPETLLWSTKNGPMRKPLTYRAPTWSWVALEGEVLFPTEKGNHDHHSVSFTSNIVGQYCQYDPPETFATVTDGWLDIDSPISAVSGWTMHAEESSLEQIRLFTHDQHEDIQNPRYWIATLDQDHSLKEEIVRHEIYLLEVLSGKLWEQIVSRRYALVLILAGQNRTGQDCYQRLGIAYMDALSSSIPATDSWARRTIRLI